MKEKILAQNNAFHAFREKMLKESPYYPEMKIFFANGEIAASTILRVKHEDKWYAVHHALIRRASTIDQFVLKQMLHEEVYKSLLFIKITPDILINGSPLFVEDKLQINEDERLNVKLN